MTYFPNNPLTTPQLLAERFSQSSFREFSAPSAGQARMDGFIAQFVEQSADARAVAAMMAGGVFYRLGETAVTGSGLLRASPFVGILSRGAGLVTEVSAYEGMNEILSPARTSYRNRWLTSFLNFGLLRMGGAVGAGQNPFLQHLVQDSAMVLGNRVTAGMGWTPTPEGDLAQQMLHAEAMNLQTSIGLSFGHALMPGLHRLQRGLELSVASSETPVLENRPPLSSIGGPEHLLVPAETSLSLPSVERLENRSEGPIHPPVVYMVSNKEGGEGKTPASLIGSGREERASGPETSPSVEIPTPVTELLRNARHVAVLTGAGISQESGIPTFREILMGTWEQFDMEKVATPNAFRENPREVWQWHEEQRHRFSHVRPNPGHFALAEMQRRVPQFTLLTQNIDGLHQAAGSTGVVELHGSVQKARCPEGHFSIELGNETVDRMYCTECGAHLRHDVVWFHEMLPQDAIQRALRVTLECDLFLTIGTSSLIQPAASLPGRVLMNQRPVVEVNVAETPFSRRATHILRGPSGEILPALVRAAWPEER